MAATILAAPTSPVFAMTSFRDNAKATNFGNTLATDGQLPIGNVNSTPACADAVEGGICSPFASVVSARFCGNGMNGEVGHKFPKHSHGLQVDTAVLHIQRLTHQQKCDVLERLIRESDLRQLRLLWTSLQPSIHRDFTYSAKRLFPDVDFRPISTPASRQMKKQFQVKQENERQVTSEFHRADSAHLQHYEQVKIVAFEDVTSSHGVRDLPFTSSRTVLTADDVLNHGGGSRRRLRRDVRTASSARLFRDMPTSRGSRDSTTATSQTTTNIDEDQFVDSYVHGWDAIKRNTFWCRLLITLDERQQYFLSSFLSLRLYRDFIALLPRPLAIRILRYLPVQQLANLSSVSKTWKDICSDSGLWKRKYLESHPESLEVLVENGEEINWRKQFSKTCSVRDNWRHGRYKVIDCQGHNGRVLSVTFNATQLATGSIDRTIKLWEISSGRCVLTLTGHLRGVWSVLFYTDNLLVSASYDTSIKIWNLRQERCTRTLLGHQGPVWAMVRRGNLLVSASQDTTAKLWDISRCSPVHSLEGHKEAVFAVDMDDKESLVFTGSADRTVRLWSSTSGQLYYTVMASPSTSIMSVAYSSGYLACCYGGTIRIYTVTLNAPVIGGVAGVKLIREYREHHDRIENLQLKVFKSKDATRSTLISAGKDAVIKYWELNSESSLQTFAGHSQQINCVFFDSTRMASASYDNSVKIWDFSSVIRRHSNKKISF